MGTLALEETAIFKQSVGWSEKFDTGCDVFNVLLDIFWNVVPLTSRRYTTSAFVSGI